MNCPICKTGSMKPGHVSVTLDRERSTVVFRNVPAHVCDACGEYLLDEPVTQSLLDRAEKAVGEGTEVQVVQYAA